MKMPWGKHKGKDIEEQIKAALVCPGKHLNPIYVPLNAIEEENA
jgi:hypothetical protein